MRRKQKVLQQLMDLGLSKPFAFSAYALFGNEAVKEVQNNPYGLIRFESRKEWKEIDQLAAKLGFEEHSAERLAGAFRYSLGLATNEGHVFLPQNELFQRVSRLIQLEDENAYHDTLDTLLEHTSLNTPIREMDEARPIYLDRLYQAETGVARSLVQLYISASRMALQRPQKKTLDGVETDLGIQLAPAQREAIASSLDNKIIIITGGPGTGKTTIVKGVLDLWGKKKGKILLAAPTGRAAKRLCESTGKPAKTIHRLLEYRLDTHTFNRNADNKLHADLLVVDEASMIDIELMASLLEALPDYCHLLFVGDVDQLPAVGPGYVLHDLIESQRFKTIHLTEIYRQDKGSLIPLNAKKINQGEIPETQGLGVDAGQDFYFIERISPEKVREAMLEMILHRIPNQFGFQPKTHIQVLCPMYKSEVGVDRMNEVLQQELNPSPHRFNAPFYTVAIGDKVMQTKNDYSKDVFNGDVGYVTHIEGKNLTLVIDFEGKEVPYTWNELENTSLAYAVTVHKSQGSEYPAVVIPLTRQFYPLLQRNLLYTAVSRGKQLVVLVGSWDAMQTAVKNNRIGKRYTGLQNTLHKAFQNIDL